MTIEAVATIVALVGVAVSFVFSFLAERRERKRTAEEASRADASAERASRSAALTIDAMERIAAAIEQLQQQGIRTSAPEHRVRWSLTHFRGDTYMLQNVGTATAYRVHVSADESLLTPGELPDDRDMRPDESSTFLAALTYDTRDDTITVEWSTSDEPAAERQTWRYPLPPKG